MKKEKKAEKLVVKVVRDEKENCELCVPEVIISEIGTDYGREDINALARKVNEIIRELNK